MTGSALRRNIAEHLSIASAAAIKARRYQPTAKQVAEIRRWLDECEIAWLICPRKIDAEKLDASLKAQFLPPLTRR